MYSLFHSTRMWFIHLMCIAIYYISIYNIDWYIKKSKYSFIWMCVYIYSFYYWKTLDSFLILGFYDLNYCDEVRVWCYQLLLGVPTSQITVVSWSPALPFQSSFLLKEGSRRWFKYLVTVTQADTEWILSFWLHVSQALAFLGSWGVSFWIEALSFSFSFILILCPPHTHFLSFSLIK